MGMDLLRFTLVPFPLLISSNLVVMAKSSWSLDRVPPFILFPFLPFLQALEAAKQKQLTKNKRKLQRQKKRSNTNIKEAITISIDRVKYLLFTLKRHWGMLR